MIPVLLGMLIYGIFHSITASRPVKRAFRNILGERAYHGLYRLAFNVISVITILPILYLVVFHEGDVVWTVDLTWEPLLLLLQGIGVVGFLIALFQTDLIRFAGLSQFIAYLRGEPLPLPDEALKTDGLYGIVRHPLYMFSLLLLWPVSTMTEAYFGFCLGSTLYFIVGSYFEEKRMVRDFGDTYAHYRQRVPWLIPFVRFGNRT